MPVISALRIPNKESLARYVSFAVRLIIYKRIKPLSVARGTIMKHKRKTAPMRAKEKAILQAEKVKAQKKLRGKRLALAALVCGAVALAAYLGIPAYQYNKAISLVQAEQYSEASQIFGGLGNYRDSVERLKAASLQAIANGKLADNSSTVYFGRYESDNKLQNGKEPIKWRVLDKTDGNVLLLADRILDIQPYNRVYDFSTWETCTLRTWLNDTFINEAFSAEERALIALSNLENNDNPQTAIEGGNPTQDKVFVLSLEEIDRYLPETEQRKAKDTGYANVLGWQYYQREWLDRKKPFRQVLDIIDIEVKFGGLKYFLNKWWLRTPGYLPGMILSAEADGVLFDRDLINLELGVRPAITVRLGE